MRTGLSVEGMGQSRAMSRSQGRVIVGPSLSRMAEVFTEHADDCPLAYILTHGKSHHQLGPERKSRPRVPHPKGSLFLNTFFSPPPKATGAVQSTENHPETPKAKAKSCSAHVLVSRVQGHASFQGHSSEIHLQGTWSAHGMPSSGYCQQWEAPTTEPAPIEKEDQASRPGIRERQMAFMQDGTG